MHYLRQEEREFSKLLIQRDTGVLRKITFIFQNR